MNLQKQLKQSIADLQSSLENSNHTKLNELNSELALVQSLVSEQFIYVKISRQEINYL